jgi:WD40 repeat protein
MKSSKSLQSFSNTPPSEHAAVAESRESFICIDQNGLMYSFSVESNQIKDSSIPLPEDGVINNVTSMSLKKDYIIYGDQDGNVIRWNYVNKLSKTVALKRGGEVRKIKFAPGKENLLFLVQFADCLEIMEATTLDVVSSYKNANAKVKLVDSYWSSSDRVLVLFSDGQIRLYDFNLKPMPANYSNSLPSLFGNTIVLKRSVVVAFKNLIYELIDSRRELNDENMQNATSNYLNNLLSSLYKKKTSQR